MNDEDRAVFALTLNNLGIRSQKLGELAEARKTLEQAMSIRLEPARSMPPMYGPGLAESCQNLAFVCLSERDTEGALVAAEAAVAVRRKLVEGLSRSYHPQFKRPLDLLGRIYFDEAGRRRL